MLPTFILFSPPKNDGWGVRGVLLRGQADRHDIRGKGHRMGQLQNSDVIQQCGQVELRMPDDLLNCDLDWGKGQSIALVGVEHSDANCEVVQ